MKSHVDAAPWLVCTLAADGTDVDGEGPFRLGRATEDPVVAERRKEDFMRHEMYFKRKLDGAWPGPGRFG